MSININEISNQQKPNTSIQDVLNKDIQIGARFNIKKKQSLYNDLFLLFNSGLDMKRVLELIVEEQKNKKEKEILNRIYQKVIKGETLSNAFAAEKDFTEYETFSLKIGEESGKLTEVLSHLKNYYQKRIEQKRQVASALSYPLVVLFIAIAAVTFMIGFVVPTFAKTFKTFNAELPGITKWLIAFSEDFSTYATICLVILVTITILYQYFKKHESVRKWKAKLILIIPFIGKIYYLSRLTQFCENMKLLVSAKTSLIESLELTSKMIDFYPVQFALKQSKIDIMKGSSLSESLKNFKIFPSRMVYLLAVGEEVNKLEEIFGQMGDLYASELEHKSKILGSVLEPILLIFIACLVGFIVIALYMPMFSLSELI
jgi:type IV pilus assembly protein PilC